MKTSSSKCEQGTVLITAMMTITILTLLSATSLYIASQNQTTGTQTASWHQAMDAAESGVDQAIAALNTDSATGWASWKVMPYSSPISGYTLPSAEPTATATPSAGGAPDSTHYNYLPAASFTQSMTGEGATSTQAWVTVDTAGMSTTESTNGRQWYRIRSTGQAHFSGAVRASMNKLDADLRNSIAMNFSRKGGAYLGPTRTIEVIMAPISSGTGTGGPPYAGTGIDMSGSGTVDSFISSNVPSPHQWSAAYRRSHGDLSLYNNTTNSDLRSTYLYGNLSYSGVVVKNTTHVSGTISTPGPAAAAAAPTPNASLTWTGYSFPGGNASYQLGNNGGSATYLKVNGDFTISGGNSLHFLADNSNNTTRNTIYIWVTGKLTTSGSGYFTQDDKVKVVFYVGGDITISGSSYQNNTGYASNLLINGFGANNKATVSGTSVFTGQIYAPKYDLTISGGGDFSGTFTVDTVTISGGSSFHYDEDLGSSSSSGTVGSYSFASWFEDNSDPSRNAKAADNNYYSIVY